MSFIALGNNNKDILKNIGKLTALVIIIGLHCMNRKSTDTLFKISLKYFTEERKLG